jgi:polar amino acid transport system substrate-binding protein
MQVIFPRDKEAAVYKKPVILALLSIGLLLLLLSCGPGAPKNTLEKVKREGKLIVATHPVNPPFEFGAGTGVDGFDYDLAEAVARGLGVKTQWIKKQFEQCFEYLKNGEVDMVVNAVTITPEREKDFLFSEPYFTTGQIMAVRKEREDIKTVADLKGKKVGVQKETTAEEFLLRLGKGEVDIVEFDSFDEALFELNRKLLDAVVGDAPTLQYDIQLLPNLRSVGPLLTSEQYGIVFRKSDVELKNEVDKIIKKMKESGEIDELVKKWKLDLPAVEPTATPGKK